MSAYKSEVYLKINKRLKSYSIDLKDYIYVDLHGESTLKVNKTTLDGVSFVEKSAIEDKVSGATQSLEYSLLKAKAKNGYRAFAGQISSSDLNNIQLQLSFLATKGKGFREIFYLPDKANPAVNSEKEILLNPDHQFFDLNFGKMADSPDITSIHVDREASITSIHLDKQGFIFTVGESGQIYLSSNVLQHVLDELIYKDKLLGLFGDNSVATFLKKHSSIIFQINHNSISDPRIQRLDMENNNFLRSSKIRGVLGVEGSYEINSIQLFARGTLGLDFENANIYKFIKPAVKPAITSKNITVGLRGNF